MKVKTTFEFIKVISSRIFFDKVDLEFAAVSKNKSEDKGNWKRENNRRW